MEHRWTIVTLGLEPSEQALASKVLGEHYHVRETARPEEALALLEEHPTDLLLCEHHLPGTTGTAFLRYCRLRFPDMVRILTGELSETELRRAINEAAVYCFIRKPWLAPQLELEVRRALENRELAYRHRHLSRKLKFTEDIIDSSPRNSSSEKAERSPFYEILYCSPSMAELCNMARKAARTNLPVLIQGETGTGKELLARAIHENSARRDRPLLVQNCGGISDELLHSELFGHKRGAFTGAVSDRLGLFPAADGGTVFLDEISEISPAFQVSLLRFLQEGEVKPLGSDRVRHCDVRIIAASNRPLSELVSEGRFRQDLYFRLNGFQLTIPPLRERPDDIPLLAEHLARRYGESINRRILGIAPEVLERLKAYHWPGNVRELENEMKRMVALAEDGEYLTIRNLSKHLVALSPSKVNCNNCLNLKGSTLKEKIEFIESELVREALQRHRWNQSRAAAELGLSRVGLANKIRRYGLNDAAPRRSTMGGHPHERR